MFWRRRAPARADRPVLWLNDRESVSLGDLYTGCIGVAGPGAGKTTSWYARIVDGVLTHPQRPGALLVSTKLSDVDMFVRWAGRAGRGADVVVLGPGGATFNPLAFELAAGGGNPDTVTPLLQSLKDIQARGQTQPGDDFFSPAISTHVTRCVWALHLTGEPVSLQSVYDFLTTAPMTPDDLPAVQAAGTPRTDGRPAPYAHRVLNRLIHLPESRAVTVTEDYWCEQWLDLSRSDRTQSCVQFGALQLVLPLISGPVGECIAGVGSTVTPADITDRGKVVVTGVGTLSGREPARLMAAAVTLSVQRHCLRRIDGRPVFIGRDEYHACALPNDDPIVAATGRSHKIAQFFALQNLNQLYGALGGGPKGEHDGKALVGCCQLKLAGANTCPTSNLFFADLIGKSRQPFFNGSSGGGSQPFDLVGYELGTWSPQVSAGFSEQLHYDVPPESFLSMRCGGPGNGWVVEGVAVHGGRVFRSGKAWTRTAVRQLL